MDLKKALDILNGNNIEEIYYNERPVWIQEINDNMAKIGFMDTEETKDVYLEDLYDSELYE